MFSRIACILSSICKKLEFTASIPGLLFIVTNANTHYYKYLIELWMKVEENKILGTHS